MHVASVTENEIQITLETMIEIVNGLAEDDRDVRSRLDDAGFGRAADASEASVERVRERMEALAPFIRSLPDLDVDGAARRVNAELTDLSITPAVVDHGGIGHHVHWTSANARFDDQVIADMLMALAQELCDNGIERFGRCDADTCEAMFYDTTRNHSRRFCSDPRCASRTHTADHRRRRSATP
jgi:predicted RNA-binding Zn ribbon-like protein